MLDYLNQTLGLSATVTPWAEEKNLPLYLRSGRKYSLLHIGGLECVLIETDEDSFNLSAFRKQMRKLPAKPEHVVLCFEHLNSRRRKALIEAGMPFIVPESQVYLPFLGIVLQERMRSIKVIPERLSPSAQFVLLCLIYEWDIQPIRKIDLAKRLELSAMNVTRAVQELEALELVIVEKAGRSDYVSAANSGKFLYEKALPYMIDPVKKQVCVRKKDIVSNLPLAGEDALAAHSMLNRPQLECRAISRKNYKALGEVEVIDPSWSTSQDHIQLQIWKYDPEPLAHQHTVDMISLALSLRENGDERVERAVEEMLEGYEW